MSLIPSSLGADTTTIRPGGGKAKFGDVYFQDRNGQEPEGKHVDTIVETPQAQQELKRNISIIMNPEDFDTGIMKFSERLTAELKHGKLTNFTGKTISTYFRNLQVRAPKPRHGLRILLSMLKSAIYSPTIGTSSSQTVLPADSRQEILNGIDGIALPGEMTLVLGRPGSGCTTFLKTMANEKMHNLLVEGTKIYSGITADIFAKRFPGETAFCAADDVHIPSLTVDQTLRFALDLSSPMSEATSQRKQEIKDDILSSLLDLLGISHTRNTMIGDTRIRGVSGGERKRVSIAETLIARATLTCFDNPTLGLDAGSATKLIRMLRILTKSYSTTTFVSLYQASDALFDCFDKVILLEGGEQLYYGPTQQAVEYFKGLGFQTVVGQSKADYLTDCIDPRHRQATAVEHTAWLKKSFRESAEWTRLQKDLTAVLQPWDLEMERESFCTISTQKSTTRWTFGSCTQPFWKQILLLAKRHWLLKMQDWFNMVVKNGTSIIVALILGSVWWQLPRTSAGAFTRGGIMFIALLFTSFTAFVELPLSVLGRPVLSKQTSLNLYRRSALSLGQLIVDVPMTALENLFFVVVVYLMAGLDRSAGAFFTFYLFIVLGQTFMTVFFRTLGAIAKNLDIAFRIACVVIIMFVLISGYLVQYKDQRPWLSWFYWINPLSYTFAGMMAGEFSRVNMTCEGSRFIPDGPQFIDNAHKVCTIAGAISGTNIVVGADYIQQTFGFEVDHIWRNVGVMFAFIFVTLVSNVTFGELLIFPDSEANHRVEQNKRKIKDMDAEELVGGKSTDVRLVSSSESLTWRQLNYTVPLKGKQTKQLLFNIDGACQPRRLLALMGPSGAGKSTLLDVLAQRKTIGMISGNLAVGGKPLDSSYYQKIGYCEQLDILDPYQTVREALELSALLRRASEVPNEEKLSYVEEVIELLNMEDIADIRIGTTTNGLSIEERKRVSIALELVAKPELLLFLDEPTSGLDSQSAINIVRFLRKLANAGQAIICTIHQPNSAIFGLFDDLLLLHQGHVVYNGTTSGIGQYFASKGFPAPTGANIAEFMLQTLTRDDERSLSAQEWSNLWRNSASQEIEQGTLIQSDQGLIEDKFAGSVSASEEMSSDNSRALQHQKAKSNPVHKTTFWFQLRLVSTRTMTSLLRQSEYSGTRLFNHVVIALLTGLAYLNIDSSLASAQYRIFVTFQVTILPSLILSQVQPQFEMARIIFQKEELSGMYSKAVFLTSMVLSEIPLSIICSVVFFLLIYYPVGFSADSHRAGYQLLVIYITEQFSVWLGQAISTLTPSSYTASLFTPFLLVIFSTFCGVTVPPPDIPSFWKWMYHLNPLTYLVGGMIETELHGQTIKCATSELAVFNPPAGQTCFEYSISWIQTSVGYLENPNSTSNCGYCPFENGSDYSAQFDLFWGNRWRDLGILAGFLASSLAIIYIAGTQLNWTRR